MIKGLFPLLSALLIGLATPLAAWSGDQSTIEPTPARFRLTYETLELPQQESMGFLGGSMLYDSSDWLALGPAAYGSIAGDRGGFITIGLATELKKSLAERLEANGGFFVGAGGGRGGYSLSGGGLMLRAHLGLSLLTRQWGALGAGLSYVSFPEGGNIDSFQPYLAYDYYFTSLPARGWLEPATGSESEVAWPGREQEFAVVYREDSIPAGVLTDGGRPQERHLDLLGVEWLRYLQKHYFLKIETAGAAGGRSNGYMQILLGGGYRLALTDSSAAKLALALGVAGGGGVATGGGLLCDVSLALQQELPRALYLEAAAGYVMAADGDFEATSLAVKLGKRFSTPVAGPAPVAVAALAGYEPQHLRWRTTQQTYFQADPAWRKHHADLDVYNLGFQCDYFWHRNIFLSGQVLAAYKGMAGAYMTGLVGGGLHLPLGSSPVFAEVEALIGAAGGGGLDVGGGLVWQVNAGLGYQLNEAFSLQGSYGFMDAVEGRFQAEVLGLSLAYHFTVFSR